MMRRYNVAVIGVGAVGREMLRVLKQRGFPFKTLKVFARSSRGIKVDGVDFWVEKIQPSLFDGIDIALFAGTEGEKGAAVTFGPEAVKRGAVVIDNGSDFRLKPDVPLLIPEINPNDIKSHRGIIANPNCTTIQLVLSIWPLYKEVGIERIILSSYQATSGAGQKAMDELFSQTQALLEGRDFSPSALPVRIAFNVFPQIGSFGELDYTTEEWKAVNETRKILHDDELKISATCVRVPVAIGHSEAIYIQTKRRLSIEDIKKLYTKEHGLVLFDDPKKGRYPLACDVAGKDEVFVGRIRKDPFNENGVWLWSVSDNLRKGAALNAVQIAELLISSNCI